MNIRRSIALWAAIAMMLMSAASSMASEGQVVEKGTGKPLSGVFVLAEWWGQAAHPVDAATVCIHGEITVTDEEGRFKVSAFSGNLNPMITSQRRDVFVYKPGFRYSQDSVLDELKFVMEPRSGAGEKEFADVLRTRASYRCGMIHKDMLPFLKARAAELASLARTPEQRRQLSSALFEAESVEFGESVAQQRSNERERELRRTPKEGK